MRGNVKRRREARIVKRAPGRCRSAVYSPRRPSSSPLCRLLQCLARLFAQVPRRGKICGACCGDLAHVPDRKLLVVPSLYDNGLTAHRCEGSERLRRGN